MANAYTCTSAIVTTHTQPYTRRCAIDLCDTNESIDKHPETPYLPPFTTVHATGETYTAVEITLHIATDRTSYIGKDTRGRHQMSYIILHMLHGPSLVHDGRRLGGSVPQMLCKGDVQNLQRVSCAIVCKAVCKAVSRVGSI